MFVPPDILAQFCRNDPLASPADQDKAQFTASYQAANRVGAHIQMMGGLLDGVKLIVWLFGCQEVGVSVFRALGGYVCGLV